MNLPKTLSKKSFAIYGLGATGLSVIRYFKKLKIKDFYAWDDNKAKKNQIKKKISIKEFSKKLDTVNYIVLSPGINIKKTRLKRKLLKNKNKIITDIDLFYINNPGIKSIVVTGTNGKSTTCKIIEHLLKKNRFKIQLGGNIGKPILNIRKSKNSLFVIEASSFQLSYSKFIKPNYALILNITKDHLDWHGNMKNYTNSKFKIFLLQEKKDFAFLKQKKLIKKFKKSNNLSSLKFVSFLRYKKIKEKIENSYLNLKTNDENMSFVYALGKTLKIKDNSFIKSLKTFKGLPHRYETFYKKRRVKFVNDSKATSFESSKFALRNNKNIFWIVGGLPKLGDKFYLNSFKKNIIKSYIIGKNTKFFERQLRGKINFKVSRTLNSAIKNIFYEIKNMEFDKEATVLLSPASASYDQYKNFEDRGNHFKKLIKLYGKKFF